MINSVIFPRPKPSSYDAATFDEGQLVHIPRPTARPSHTFGIWLPHPTPASNLLIYAHPNAVDIGHMQPELEWLGRALQVHVLLVEYRGYGQCEGLPEEEEINIDLEAAVMFAVDVLGAAPSRIILMGRSIGTGPTTNFAFLASGGEAPPPGTPVDGAVDGSEGPSQSTATQRYRSLLPGALVLVAPFKSIRECVGSLAQAVAPALSGIAARSVGDRFRTVDRVPKVACPVLVIHGRKDTIVPYSHGEAIVKTAREAGKSECYLHTLECGHNDIPPKDAARAIAEFLRTHPEATGGGHATFACPVAPWHSVGRPFFDQLGRGATTRGFARAALPYQMTYALASFASVVRLAWLGFQQISRDLDLARFIDACLALWGSPLAVYEAAPHPAVSKGGDAPPAPLLFFGEFASGDTALGSYYDLLWRHVAATMSGDEAAAVAAPKPLALRPVFAFPLGAKLRQILVHNVAHMTRFPKPGDTTPDPGAAKLRALTRNGVQAVQFEVERLMAQVPDATFAALSDLRAAAAPRTVPGADEFAAAHREAPAAWVECVVRGPKQDVVAWLCKSSQQLWGLMNAFPAAQVPAVLLPYDYGAAPTFSVPVPEGATAPAEESSQPPAAESDAARTTRLLRERRAKRGTTAARSQDGDCVVA